MKHRLTNSYRNVPDLLLVRWYVFFDVVAHAVVAFGKSFADSFRRLILLPIQMTRNPRVIARDGGQLLPLGRLSVSYSNWL